MRPSGEKPEEPSGILPMFPGTEKPVSTFSFHPRFSPSVFPVGVAESPFQPEELTGFLFMSTTVEEMGWAS